MNVVAMRQMYAAITDQAAAALERIAAQEGRTRQHVVESALIAYGILTDMTMDNNTLWRCSPDGDLVQINLTDPYHSAETPPSRTEIPPGVPCIHQHCSHLYAEECNDDCR